MPTERDNAFLLVGSDLTDVVYVPGSFFITEGQPHDGNPTVTPTAGGDKWLVWISCGRSGSVSIATLFNSTVTSTNHQWTGPYSEQPLVSTNKPSELNFYFGLDLHFRGVSAAQRVYVAQGRALHMFNNWWIAGSNVLNTNPGYSLMTYFYIDAAHTYLISSIDDASPAMQFDLHV